MEISDNERLARIMKQFPNKQEALEILAYDKAVDKMTGKEIEADLSDEQKKVMKEMRRVGRARKEPTVYNLKPKTERAPDEVKVEIITKLYDYICDFAEDVNIKNSGKLIEFALNGDNYELDLKRKRKRG